ncbi:MAG: SulP family inorganic anion transporter [Burkholderiales bacterium]|nr:SulP family inorganic anion transporter [Burkholderiales bacterium]
MVPLARLFPFLRWPAPTRQSLRADLVAGVTVALVLVPQSMAYAQLAGLPPQYGLYTALAPVLVAGLWGSCAQLATGPVAVVSLLTAAALAPIAAHGSPQYVALAVALAFLVGCIQLALGALRLGFAVNFLSHPVIAGFTSAAAIVIALSQLGKMLGVPMPRSDVFLRDVWAVLEQWRDVHLPTLAFGAGALLAMLLLRRFAPRWPGVLIVVAIATAISAAIGFERSASATVGQIADPEARALLEDYLAAQVRLAALAEERRAKQRELARTEGEAPEARQRAAALRYEIELLDLRIEERSAENRGRLRLLRQLTFEQTRDPSGATLFVPADGAGGRAGSRWRIQSLDADGIRLQGGGEVVGRIPPGLPPIALPALDLATVAGLLSAALVISLVGFAEAVSIAKAISARTRTRLDPNQELIGQGLANLVGSLTQCFPASGSFSRSAVNFQAGARTGLASAVAAAIVMLTLLFLTPLLYHLPQAVLAAVIMMAVVSLVNFGGLRHAWQVQRHDGLAGVLTFVAALAFAPHLDLAILAGAGLSVLLFLYRTMRPRVTILELSAGAADGRQGAPPAADGVVALRYDGQLYFGNVSYFEDTLLELAARRPGVRTLLVVADGINQIDASGEEAVRRLVERLDESGVALAFCGLKPQVREVLEATGLAAQIGEGNFFADLGQALEALSAKAAARTAD